MSCYTALLQSLVLVENCHQLPRYAAIQREVMTSPIQGNPQSTITSNRAQRESLYHEGQLVGHQARFESTNLTTLI